MKKFVILVVFLSFGLWMGCYKPTVPSGKPPTPEQDAEWRKRAMQDDPPPVPDGGPAKKAAADK